MPLAKLGAKKSITRVISVVFYTALIIFLILYIKNLDYSTLAGLQFDLQFVVLASLLGLLMRACQAANWLVILNGLGAKGLVAYWRQLGYVYAKSWLGRYIPGTAPWILGKIYFASRLGIPKSKLAISSFLEALLQITVILAFSSVLLILDDRFSVIDSTIRLLLIIVLAACFVVIFPPVFNRLLTLGFRIVKKAKLPSEHHIPARVLTRGILLYLIAGVFYGSFMFFLAKAMYPALGYENLLFVIGAGNLAGVVGMLAIFLPSGIGVREGMQLILFSLIMPPEIALAITIMTRLWDVVLDLLFFVCMWLLKKGRGIPPPSS